MNKWNIPEEMENAIKRRDKKCVYCGIALIENIKPGQSQKNQATWEHIVNDQTIISYENIARCCTSCNSSKGTKKLSDWINSVYCKKKNINFDSVAKIIKDALEKGL